MMLPSASLRRARPLLGTIVQIRVEAPRSAALDAAIAAAFDAVARVEALMSVHARDSELSRLNGHGHEREVVVDPWTYAVLAAAERFWLASGGLFDCTVGAVLARHGFLPRHAAATGIASTSQADVLLLGDRRVRFARPLALDLGGIAKGFAVDRAVEALQARGVPAGAVDAGGDLRVFGAQAETVHLRDPRCPGRLVPIGRLAQGAIATSGAYFARRRIAGRWLSPIIDPHRGAPLAADHRSVSVLASDAMTADALTKPVMLLGSSAVDLLRRFGARALLCEGDAAPREIAHAA